MKDELYGGILTDKRQLGPYPMEKLARVEKPTTRIIGDVHRVDVRGAGTYRATRGDYGPFAAKETPRAIPKYPIGAVLKNITFHFESRADGPIMPGKAPIPENPEILSRHIKRLGYFLKADIMGICQIPPYAVYKFDGKGNSVELYHKFAILIVVDQEYETMCGSTGTDWISGPQSYIAYSTSAFIASIMAEYIRKLGYPARAQHVGTYQVAITPLLIWAGIGEMSRMGGSALNPFIGARFKAAAVTTDLPLIPDKPIDFGLQEFCRVCKKCAIECPVEAIPMGDKVIYNGYETWRHDEERCTKFRFTHPDGSSCGRCIKVCPWKKPQGMIHDAIRWMIKNTPWLDKFFVKTDDFWGYGRQEIDKKWWFDMEEIDGVLQTPKKKTE